MTVLTSAPISTNVRLVTIIAMPRHLAPILTASTPIGYGGDVTIGCIDIDGCATEKDEYDENAACTNNVDSYTCACNVGFEGTGRICEDINQCETDDSICNGVDALYQNFPGAYIYRCPN